MPSIILESSKEKAGDYILNFTNKKNIKEFNKQYYEQKLGVDDAREIKHTLSLTSDQARCFVFLGGLTIEAQNSLLKTVEEADDNVYFFFCVAKSEMLLPTIISRSNVIRLQSDFEDLNLSKILINMDKSYWENIDELSKLDKEKLKLILMDLRDLLLDQKNLDKERYFSYCKNFLKYYPLLSSNNVNKAVVLEKVFSPFEAN